MLKSSLLLPKSEGTQNAASCGIPNTVTRTVIRSRRQAVPVAPPTCDAVPFSRLASLIEGYVIQGDIERHSEATLTNKRYRLGRLQWLGDKQGWKQVGHAEMQRFFLYLNHAHEKPPYRWDNPRETQGLKPGSVKSFHSTLRSFFAWLVADGEITVSPMGKIPPPVDRPDQVQPFTQAQVNALLCAAKQTSNPDRNEAMLYVLIDCGVRVSELSALVIGDVDFQAGEVLVREGKGGKSRAIPFGRNTKRALWNYLQRERRGADESEPLFLSDRGIDAGVNQLTRRGIAIFMERLGKRAKLPATVRCSPHTARHYFAVNFLRNGANIFALKQALGHTSMAMVNRYLSLSQADLAAAHRIASPGDSLKRTTAVRKEGR